LRAANRALDKISSPTVETPPNGDLFFFYKNIKLNKEPGRKEQIKNGCEDPPRKRQKLSSATPPRYPLRWTPVRKHDNLMQKTRDAWREYKEACGGI
jgi:hypothetical protein